jgi:hypothetical protein
MSTFCTQFAIGGAPFKIVACDAFSIQSVAFSLGVAIEVPTPACDSLRSGSAVLGLERSTAMILLQPWHQLQLLAFGSHVSLLHAADLVGERTAAANSLPEWQRLVSGSLELLAVPAANERCCLVVALLLRASPVPVYDVLQSWLVVRVAEQSVVTRMRESLAVSLFVSLTTRMI